VDKCRETSSTPPPSTPSYSRSRRSSPAHQMSTLLPPPPVTIGECHHRAEAAASTLTHRLGEPLPFSPCPAGPPSDVDPCGEDHIKLKTPMSHRYHCHGWRTVRGDRGPARAGAPRARAASDRGLRQPTPATLAFEPTMRCGLPA
jgi:hypothetical protein